MLGSPDNGIPVARTPKARRRAIVMPLVIALAVAAVALLLWRGGPDQPRGAGSSLAQPLIERAAGDWRNTRNADNPARVKATSGQSARYQSDSMRSRHFRVSRLTGPSLKAVVR